MKIASRVIAPRLALTLGLLLALAGCGQKGPLYIPQPDQPAHKVEKKADKKAPAPATNPNPGTPTVPEPAPFGTSTSAASSSASSAPATNPTPN